MVSTRRRSFISPVEQVDSSSRPGISTSDTTRRRRPSKSKILSSNEDEDGYRAAKRRRTVSPSPEKEAVAGLPDRLEGLQDVPLDTDNAVEDAEIAPNISNEAIEEVSEDAILPDMPKVPIQEPNLPIMAADVTMASEMKDQGYARTVSRMRVDSLPILDNLSTQMLSTMAKSSYSEMVSLLSNPESEAGQGYFSVRSLFTHAKRVYSTREPFLFAAQLGLLEPKHVDILRQANLATLASSLFGAQDVSLQDMNEHFLDIFVPEGGRLLKAQGSLYLDLKTQAFIASAHKERDLRTNLLYHFFPDDLEAHILARRPGAKSMAPSESDFVKRALSRREILLNDIAAVNGVENLPNKYHWQTFLRDVLLYINKNYDMITNQPIKKPAKEPSQAIPTVDSHSFTQTELENNFPVEPVTHPVPLISMEQPKQDDFVARAARAAQIALQGHGLSMSPPSFDQTQGSAPHSPQPQQPPYNEMPTFQQYQPPGMGSETSSNGSLLHSQSSLDIPHASQTAPTQILYERARQAATAKSSSPAPVMSRNKLGNNAPSQRRPWTTEEENALMAGLDRVRGPHWSQILAMFGPGGTVSEALKDRNQVQLKDKARNLKLFFLKNGIEVPYYLKYVTGDLKTRAPGQVSKNEARDRERREGEEVKAHYDGVQGMMALASASHSGYTEAVGSGSGSLPASAQAAFDRIMAQLPSQPMDDGQPLDPELLSSVASVANEEMEDQMQPAGGQQAPDAEEVV